MDPSSVTYSLLRIPRTSQDLLDTPKFLGVSESLHEPPTVSWTHLETPEIPRAH
jgi:hypothetical protein